MDTLMIKAARKEDQKIFRKVEVPFLSCTSFIVVLNLYYTFPRLFIYLFFVFLFLKIGT